MSDAESLLDLINVKTVASRDRKGGSCLSKLIARAKVLPVDVNIKPEVLLERIRNSIHVGSIKRYSVEPIAFGLNALLIDFIIEDAEGGTEALEDSLKETEGVSQVDIIGVSRASATI